MVPVVEPPANFFMNTDPISTVSGEAASTTLDEIAAFAIAQNYFATQFRVLIQPPSESILGEKLGEQLRSKFRVHMLEYTWTVVRDDDGALIGFAATNELPLMYVKTRNIAWFYAHPAHKNWLEETMINHIEKHDAAEYGDITFEAELDIALWRRLRRLGFTTGIPRMLLRDECDPTKVVNMAQMFTLLKAHFHSEITLPADVDLDLLEKQKRMVAAADSFIDSESSTVAEFDKKFPSLIRKHHRVPTLSMTMPISDEICLPAGSKPAPLPPWAAQRAAAAASASV